MGEKFFDGLIRRCERNWPLLFSICTVISSQTKMCDSASVQMPRGRSPDPGGFPV